MILAPDIEITLIRTTADRPAYLLAWRTPDGLAHNCVCVNRNVLGHKLLVEVIPLVRGDYPQIDERIDIHAAPDRGVP